MRERREIGGTLRAGPSEKSSVIGACDAARGAGCARGALNEKFIGAGNAGSLDGAVRGAVWRGCVVWGRGDGGGGNTGRGIAMATGGSGGGGRVAAAGAPAAPRLAVAGPVRRVWVARAAAEPMACGTGFGAGGGAGGAAGAGAVSCGFGKVGPFGEPPSNTIATVAGGGSSSSAGRS